MFLFMSAVHVSTRVTSQVGTQGCFGLDSVTTGTALALMVYLIRKVVGKLEFSANSQVASGSASILELAKSNGAAQLTINHLKRLLIDSRTVESFHGN